MVLDHYQLRETPFGLEPDARYLYLGTSHQRALASLLSGLQGGRGFVALIAPPGLGKTTLLYYLLDTIQQDATIVYLSQALHSPLQILRSILRELGEPVADDSVVALQAALRSVFAERFRAGKRVVLVVDEAQNLDEPLLEMVRMLSNFELASQKLIQIVLAGQPLLAQKLASPGLLQLRQRISVIARLEPLSAEETERYIHHRLETAGYVSSRPLFTKDAVGLVARHSGGVPRNINHLCFNALSTGFAFNRKTVNKDIVSEVVDDVTLDRWRRRTVRAVRLGVTTALRGSITSHVWKPVLGVTLLMVLAVALFAYHRGVTQGAIAGKTTAKPASQPAFSLPAASVANPIAKPVTPATLPPDSFSQPAAPKPPTELTGMDRDYAVRALSGRSLMSICKENFGDCDASRLAEIQRLNPRLAAPQHTKHTRHALQEAKPAADATQANEKAFSGGHGP